MRLGYTILIIPLLLLLGCASNNEMKRPFMFKEAKLPAGFPSPGPVREIIVKEYPSYRMARIQRGEGGIASGPTRTPPARWAVQANVERRVELTPTRFSVPYVPNGQHRGAMNVSLKSWVSWCLTDRNANR